MANICGFRLFWPLLLVWVPLNSCRMSQAAKTLPKSANEIQSSELDDDKVPMDLWSPARRKANASFYYLSGEYETLGRNMPKARKLLDNAYNLDPNPFLAAKLLETIAGENIGQALQQAKKMILLYPKAADLQLLYGRLLSVEGQFDLAQVHLRLAIKFDPQKLESFVVLLQLLQAQQKIKEAVVVAKSMLQVNSDFADGWVQLARLYLNLKQKKLALDAAKHAFDLSSNDPEKVQLYAVLLNLNGQSSKSVEFYEAILRLDPTNDDLIARMISIFKQIGPLEDSIKMLQMAEIEAKREVPGVRLQMAFVYWEMQKFVEASSLLDDLAVKYPQSERVVYMAGLGQERIGQVDRALQTYQGFDASSEFFIHTRYRIIEIHRKAERFDQSMTTVREVIDSQVERSVDFYSLGASLLAGKQLFKEAIKLLGEGYEKHPNRIDILFLKAVNLERIGQFDECMLQLKLVIEKDPDHAAAHNYLGYMLAEKQIDLEDAEYHVKKALEIKPDDGYYLDSLGWVFFQKGLYQQALETLLKANAQVPDEGVILEHLADTYAALGNLKKAQEVFEKAIKTKLEDKDRLRIQEKYERILKKNT